MDELYKLNKSNIKIMVEKNEKYPNIALIKVNGKLYDNTIPYFLEAFTVLTNKKIYNAVIDLSGLNKITKEGWEALVKRYELFNDSKGELVLIRMRPFIYDLFKKNDIEGKIPHFRAYGDALEFIKENQEVSKKIKEESKEITEQEDNLDEDLKEEQEEEEENINQDIDEESKVEDESFPLEKSRQLTKEREGKEEAEEVNESEIIPSISDMEDMSEDIVEQDQASQDNKESKKVVKKEDNEEDQIINKKSGQKVSSESIDEKLRETMLRKVYEWKSSGFHLDILEEKIENDLNKGKKLFSNYSKKINKIKSIKKRLNNIDTTGFEQEISELEDMFYNLMDIEDIKRKFNQLLTEVEKKNKITYNPLFDFSFENYIKGKCNDLVYDMANHIVDKFSSYREPIFLYGPIGSGKTHLLNAVGNKVVEKHKATVSYIPFNEFEILLEEHLNNNTITKFRKKLFENDFILFDDFHNIADNKKALFEFRYLLDKVINTEINLFIASAEKMEDIEGISKDLLSRLKNSIYLKLDKLDSDTFNKIINSKIENEGIQLTDKVIELIYKKSSGKIREANGLLNTLAIYYDMKKEVIDIDLAKYILGYDEKEERVDEVAKPKDDDKIEKDQDLKKEQTEIELEEEKEFEPEFKKDEKEDLEEYVDDKEDNKKESELEDMSFQEEEPLEDTETQTKKSDELEEFEDSEEPFIPDISGEDEEVFESGEVKTEEEVDENEISFESEDEEQLEEKEEPNEEEEEKEIDIESVENKKSIGEKETYEDTDINKEEKNINKNEEEQIDEGSKEDEDEEDILVKEEETELEDELFDEDTDEDFWDEDDDEDLFEDDEDEEDDLF